MLTEAEYRWSAWTVVVCAVLMALTLLLAAVARAEAQTQVPSPTPATTRIAWDHDGLNTDRYELVVDGKVTDLGKLTPANGTTYEVPFPALTPGPHPGGRGVQHRGLLGLDAVPGVRHRAADAAHGRADRVAAMSLLDLALGLALGAVVVIGIVGLALPIAAALLFDQDGGDDA